MSLSQGNKTGPEEASLQRESQFHDHKVLVNARRSCSRFYSITRASRALYEESLRSCCRGKRILDYGCGTGSTALDLTRLDAIVTGIDISSAAIEQAQKRAGQEREGTQPAFLVMNAEELDFPSASFDIVCGGAILHHLNLDRSLSEITRV